MRGSEKKLRWISRFAMDDGVLEEVFFGRRCCLRRI